MSDPNRSTDPDVIHRALAAQLRANIAADVNVYAWPVPDDTGGYPRLTVVPARSPYVDYFESFGPFGRVTLRLRVLVEANAANDESVFAQVCQFLAVGPGAGSSIAEAILADTTLGGVVDSAVPMSGEWAAPGQPWLAWVDVDVIAQKQGAGA